MRNTLTLLIGLLFSTLSFAQQTDVEALKALESRLQKKQVKTAERIEEYKQKYGESSVLQIDNNGVVQMLVGFEKSGKPIFYTTYNTNAAKSVGTNKLHSGAGFGYSLSGSGINLGEWDGGAVRASHQELDGRVTQVDGATTLSNHATHVAGTMLASGLDTNAKGMAYQATLSAHDFSNDEVEMAAFAQNASSILSNHSYGNITGWNYNSSESRYYFWGDTAYSQTEDFHFGFYTFFTSIWDTIAYSAPYYLIVKSAGNDRNDAGPAPGDTHMVYSNVLNTWVPSTASRGPDCPTGYDCIPTAGNAKNILTVGAVNDIPGGWSQPSDVVMSSFSGWGPTDDGRIKPDIVGNGISLYSSGAGSNTDYYNSSGTSMSAPNVTGSLALVQEHYQNKTGGFMLSSALKALVIQTANEAGSANGPDYQHGWGMLNTFNAVEFISDTVSSLLTWDTLANGDSLEYVYYYDGNSPLTATICWTDPAATPLVESLNPTTSMLVNDLDFRAIHDTSGNQAMPWILNPSSPSAAATTGDNFRDNVEKIELSAPAAGYYTFKIKHKGTLASPQVVSVVIGGFTNAPNSNPPVADFTVNDTAFCVGDTLLLADISTNAPTSRIWTVSNASISYSFSQQNAFLPLLVPGTYDVKLVVSNAFGQDSIIQPALITVDSIPSVTFNFYNDVCADGGAQALNPFANPSGGVYSGTGVVGNFFDPQVAGLGTHVITYVYTTPGGCISQVTDTTVVVPGVTASHLPVPPICIGSAPINLTGGTPAGGTYTGSGVSNNIFYPDSAGVGLDTLVYEFVNQFGCSDTVHVPVSVVSGTTASLSNLADACENNGLVTLSGGAPSGGYYSGVGVDTLNGTFDPLIAGVGTHTISYTASNGVCISTDTALISVLPSPMVSYTASFGAVCSGSSPVVLNGGLPTGGIYSGVGVSAGSFDPAISGNGTFTVTYSYTDSNGCSASDTSSIQVSNSVTVTMRDSAGICSDMAPFALNLGSPFGGTYSGPGVDSSGMFTPGNAGAGTVTVYYEYDTNGCIGMDSALLTVVQAPIVSFGSLGSICINEDSLLLSATPATGIFSGPGVSNGYFIPSTAGLGTHTIDYTVSDTFGCNTTESQTIEVVTGLAEIQGLDSVYCEGDAPVVVLGVPSGGVLSGPGISGISFDPSAAGAGVHTIMYSTSGACADTTTVQVEVVPSGSANPILGSSIANQNTVFTYMVQPVSGMSVQWFISGGSIISTNNNIVDVQWGSGTTGALTAVQSYLGGCSDSTTLRVELWTVGLNELEGKGVQVYPNPSSDIINVQVNNGLEINRLELYSVTGAVIQKELNKGASIGIINVSSLAQGVYWLQIELFNGERIVHDVIVE